MSENRLRAWTPVLLVLAAVFSMTLAAPAQTYTVLHSFSGTPDGANPIGGLIRDAAGNLYGTTSSGGHHNAGTVYRLTPAGTITEHSFTGGADGGSPVARLRFYKGFIYGTTSVGGDYGQGTVFKVDVKFHETVLYSFTGGADGSAPASSLIRDEVGNLYGTATLGGDPTCYCDAYGVCQGCGTLFELSPTGVLTVLHTFAGGSDGATPFGTLVLDAAGNLYGATIEGGGACGPNDARNGCGTVFKLDPSGNETVLHAFHLWWDGYGPNGVVMKAGGTQHGNTLRGRR